MHAGKIHCPDDLSQRFVYSIYLARTMGISPEEASRNVEGYFQQLAGRYSYAFKSQFPWTLDNLVIAFVGSGAILVALWFLPSVLYMLVRAVLKFISDGFR